MKRSRVRNLLIILACFPAAVAGWAADAPPEAAADYRVIGFNDLGMHCLDDDFSVLSLLPPFNVVHAQVIRKGPVPVLLGPAEVRVKYQAMADRTGSINTSSALLPTRKTNFWRYVEPLFGVTLPRDQGLAGARMPGPANTPRLFQSYAAGKGWFEAKGIPITSTDDSGAINPFPLMKVTAYDLSDRPLDSIPVVLPNASEFHCEVCHQTGSDAASDGFHGVPASDWSQRRNLTLQVRENILILHDAMNGTKLFSQKPVLCAKCHYTAALDLAHTGPTGTQINPATGKPYSFMSRAVHRHHGRPQLNGVPIPDEGINTCYYCHPGTKTQCLRGVMSGAGMVCQSCHGGLLAVARSSRRPWKDLPKCQSCHTGDALSNYGGEIVRRVAYLDGPDVATPLIPRNKRFAENPNPADPDRFLLFRDSLGHPGAGGAPGPACSACHGSPHAEWPVSDPAANDNLAPKQLQGYAGAIAECSVCHGKGYSPPAGKLLGGPHGMHAVYDPNWYGIATYDHKYYINQDNNPAKVPVRLRSCQRCHGRSFEGTVLSRASRNRIFYTGPMADNQITVKKGTPVHCGMCHATPVVP